MLRNIENILYFYTSICISLLLFNIIYMIKINREKKRFLLLKTKWCNILEQEINLASHEKKSNRRHFRFLYRNLKKIQDINSFYQCIIEKAKIYPQKTAEYILLYRECFEKLAYFYEKKPPIYRGYYTYLLGKLQQISKSNFINLFPLLISYIDDSNPICREIVLNTLYISGDVNLIEQVYLFLSYRNIPHDKTLLLSGLMHFHGDKNLLCQHFWNHIHRWNEYYLSIILAFIKETSPDFKDSLFKVLQNKRVSLTIKLDILPYFEKYYYPQVHPILLSYLSNREQMGNALTAEACNTLRNYPGEKTITALKEALSSNHLLTVNNAATTLLKLLDSPEERRKNESPCL